MTKPELAQKLAEKTGLTQKEANAAVDGFVEVITEALAEKEQVRIVGFGTFGVRWRKAHTGINPATQEKIEIPEKYVPVFTPGKSLKDAVN